MAGLNLIKAFLDQASAEHSKSTVIKPIAGMMVIFIGAIFGAGYIGLPMWIFVLFAVFAAITMLLFAIAFLYCLFKNPDALRSEKYSIQKLAIEKGFVGDDLMGIVKTTRSPSGDLVEGPFTENMEGDK